MQLRPHQQEAIEVLSKTERGIVAMATGAGKTNVQIFDTKREFEKTDPQTVVVVAPRILLASQLSFDYGKHIDNAKFLHVHTKNGKVRHYHTTNAKTIKEWTEIHKFHHKLIFATYHSLKKIYVSGIKVDTFMFDESHNSTSAGFHEYVKNVSEATKRCYHFTATPRFSSTIKKAGMNDPVYGGIIAKATASELIKGGYILKPRVISHPLEWIDERTAQHDADDILNIIQEYDLSKLLVCVKSTPKMMEMLSETNFAVKLEELGYDLLHITAQHGAFHNGQKIERDKFFEVLDELGSSTERKYVILNYSILGEGINVKSLDAVLLMRQLNLIKLVQNIGRILRISTEDSKAIEEGTLEVGDYDSYLKPEGKVIIPIYNKNLQAVSDTIHSIVESVYENGEIPIMQDRK
jgi:superfamily II DNA or RNA helicase